MFLTITAKIAVRQVSALKRQLGKMNVSSENEAVSWEFNVTVLFPYRLFTMRTTKTKSKASGVKLRAMTWQSQK